MVVEVFRGESGVGRKDFVPKFVSAVKLVEPEYLVLLPNLVMFQKLFKLKYREHVSDLALLAELVGCLDVKQLVKAERCLDAWLSKVLGGSIRADLIELVCVSCLRPGLTNFAHDGEEIRKCCSLCGEEADDSFSDIDDFGQDIDRDSTFQPASKASYSDGMGCTFDPNKDRMHKHLLYEIANNRNILWSDFMVDYPDIAALFQADVGEADSFEVVWAGGFVYCRIDRWVRHVPVDDYFRLVNGFWHQFDGQLRKTKLCLEMGVKSDLRTAKEYGLKLCEKYGFNNKDRDQAFYNTVGHEIALMKHQVKVQRRKHIPEKRLVDTIFYICLLRFDRKGIATKVKSELDIDVDLINYYNDYKQFLRDHDKVNGSTALLSAVEQENVLRKIL